MQTRDQIREQVRNDIRQAVREARDAAREAAQVRADAPVLAQAGTPASDQTMQVLRAEITAVKQEIAVLTQQLNPGQTTARDRAINTQIDAATERLQSLQAQLDRVISGDNAVALVPPIPPDTIPREAVVISITFLALAAATIILVPIVRAWARWLDRRGHAAPASPDVGPRLDRIEQAIEAVAIEVERVSEGQRFTNKLMGEMRGLPAPAEGRWPAAAAREPVMARRPEEG